MAKKESTEKVDVGRWVSAAFTIQPGPVKIELRHVSASDNSAIVETWTKVQWEQLRLSATQLGDEIYERASDDAKGLRGNQKYVIFCFTDEREDSVRRKQFNVMGKLLLGSEGYEESEPATEKGYMSQIMRHAEQKERMAWRMIEGLIASQDRRIAQLEGQNDRMVEKHFDIMQLTETLIDRREDRDLQRLKEKNAEELHQSIFKKVDLLLPTMASKVLPEAGFERLQIAAFFESLTPPQVDKIASVLNPAQNAMLIKMLISKGADPKMSAQFIEGLSEEQYGMIVSILSPAQMGVLNDYYQALMKAAEAEEKRKAEEEQNGKKPS